MTERPARGTETTRRTFLQIATALVAAGAQGWVAVPASARKKPRNNAAGGRGAIDLIDEDFFVMLDRDGFNPSGWDVRQAGGNTSYSYAKWFRVTDSNSRLPVSMTKWIASQAGCQLVLEFRVNPITDITGATWQLREGGEPLVSIRVLGGQLVLDSATGDSESLAPCAVGVEVGVRVAVDLVSRRVDVDVNGVRRAALRPLLGTASSIDNFFVHTGVSEQSDMYFGPVRLHRGFGVRETFTTCPVAQVPDNWTTTGAGAVFSVVRRLSHSYADPFCLRIDASNATGEATAATPFVNRGEHLILEARYFAGGNPEGSVLDFNCGANLRVRIDVRNNQLRLVSGAGVATVLANYATNVWHHVRLELNQQTTSATVSINGKKRAQDVIVGTLSGGTPTPNSIVITVPRGIAALVDDVIVRPLETLSDYPPPPAVTAEANLHVGVTEFAGWREGYHFGWDLINPYRQTRQPYLGWYDEGSPEVSDWEITWMVNNGITFRMGCWFRPHDGMGTPIKKPRVGHALHDGFFNARYSDRMKFAIMWENINGGKTNSADFRDNIVPFWLEYYFSDPRYLVIDNKPILSVFRVAPLLQLFGGTVAGVKAEIDYLRFAVQARGFDDIILLTSLATADAATMGFSGEHRYSPSPVASQQKADLERQRDSGFLPAVTTLGMGLDGEPWTGNPGSYVPVAEYLGLAQWARDQFIPSLPADSPGRKIVVLDNWNEYGEGHFLMPSSLAGFGYLNAIRDVYGGSSAPDVRPTAAQLARIRNLYPPNREFPLAETTGPTRTSTFSPSWNFDTDGDTEGWTVLKEVDGLTASGGLLRGSSTTSDPGLQSSDNLGLQSASAPYALIRLRMDPPVGAQLFWLREGDADYSANRAASIRVEAQPGFQEIELPLWRSGAWRGIIRRLRLDPINNSPGTFEIDYVRIMQVPVPAPRVVVNNVLSRVPGAVYGDADTVMVPLASVVRLLGGKAEWDPAGRTLVTVLGSTVLSCTVDSEVARRNDEEIAVVPAPAIGADSVVRVPATVLSAAFGSVVEWDSTTETLSVR